MAGRGRGSLINEFLRKTSAPSSDSANIGNDAEVDYTETESSPSQTTSRSPNLLLGLTKFDSPAPSAGRGLMTPTQFMAPSKLALSKQTQPSHSFASSNEKQEKESSESENEMVKGKSLIEAEKYLEKYMPHYLSRNSFEESLCRSTVTPNNTNINKSKASFNTSIIPSKSQQQTQRQQHEAEAEWQQFKLQRQINRILSNITPDDFEEVVSHLKKRIDDNSFSSKFPQFSEFQVVLKTVIDKAVEDNSFLDASQIIVRSIADSNIQRFKAFFPDIISSMASDIVKVTASDKKVTATTKSFCRLLGKLVVTAADHEDRFCEVVLLATQDCVEQWTYPDGIGDEVEGFRITKAETHANAVSELLNQITKGQFTEESIGKIMPSVKKMLNLVKESVLNEFLPRNIRDIYMDSLIANAWKWLIPGENNTDDSYKDKSMKNIDLRLKFFRDAPTTKHISESESLVSQELMDTNENMRSEFDEQDTDLISQLSENYCVPKDSSIIEDDDIGSTDFDLQDETRRSNLNQLNADGPNLEHFNADDSDVIIEESSEAAEEDFKGDGEDGYQLNLEPEISEKDLENKDDPFCNIRRMMKNLKLEDQTCRFENNFIRDSALNADREILKSLLKESNFPAGLIYEICLYLDKQDTFRKQNLPPKSPTSFNSPNSTSSAKLNAAPNVQLQSGDVMPRRKLLGIGRGMTSESGTKRPMTKPSSSYAKKHENQFSNNQIVKQEQYRSSSRNDYLEGKQKQDDSNWRSATNRNARQGGTSNRQSRPETVHKAWNSPGSRSWDSEEDRSLQVGKVQPIQQQKQPRPSTNIIQPNRTKKPINFDGRPPGCLKCGSKSHFSNECKNNAQNLLFD